MPTNATSPSSVPLLIDRLEAARLLGVSPGTIDNLRNKAGLPSIKLLGRRLYDVADLHAYINARKQTAKPPAS